MKSCSVVQRWCHHLYISLIGNETLGRIMMRVWPRRVQGDAESLFDLISGFVYSQVLFAVVKLDLLPLLKKKPAILMTSPALQSLICRQPVAC